MQFCMYHIQFYTILLYYYYFKIKYPTYTLINLEYNRRCLLNDVLI